MPQVTVGAIETPAVHARIEAVTVGAIATHVVTIAADHPFVPIDVATVADNGAGVVVTIATVCGAICGSVSAGSVSTLRFGGGGGSSNKKDSGDGGQECKFRFHKICFK